jgi:uncharacterized membrane protein
MTWANGDISWTFFGNCFILFLLRLWKNRGYRSWVESLFKFSYLWRVIVILLIFQVNFLRIFDCLICSLNTVIMIRTDTSEESPSVQTISLWTYLTAIIIRLRLRDRLFSALKSNLMSHWENFQRSAIFLYLSKTPPFHLT